MQTIAWAPLETPPPEPAERRAAQRFPVFIPGRYAVAGQPEHSCVTENVSPEGAAIRGLVIPRIDQEVVCDLRGVGRIGGPCVRHTGSGFVVSIRSASLPLGRLAALLRQIAETQEVGAAPKRGFERLVPSRTDTTLALADGTAYAATIINMSPSGVALSAPVRPPVDSVIFVGRTPARVVRHFESGIGAAFLRALAIGEVTTDIVL